MVNKSEESKAFSNNENLIIALEKLSELNNSGIISNQEYNNKRKIILNKIK